MSLLDFWKKMDDNQTDDKTLSMLYSTFLYNQAKSEFVWSGLPDTLKHKQWYIEYALIKNGCIAAFRDSETGMVSILKAFPIGNPTLHGDYTKYQLVGENGVCITKDRDEIAVCWDSISRVPFTRHLIKEYAKRMCDTQRTNDERMIHHMAPVIFVGNKKFINSAKEFIKGLKNHKSHYVVDEQFVESASKNQSLTFDAPFIGNELHQYKQKLISEFLYMRGINYNPETGKKERMITDEAHANDESVAVNRYIYEQARKDFINEAKEKFPEFSQLKCEYLGDIISKENEKIKEEGESDANNQTIVNTSIEK